MWYVSRIDEPDEEMVLYNKLKKIREELNSYIDSRLNIAEPVCYAPILQEFPKGRSKACQVKPVKCLSDFSIETSVDMHPGLDKVLNNREESFSTMLLRMIDEKGLKDSDVYKRANIDRRLFSKIRGDENYVPSRKTAISFCLALQLEMDEAEKLLATAGYTLSASSRFDIIIMYLIENGEYNIHFANIVLDDYGEGTLSR